MRKATKELERVRKIVRKKGLTKKELEDKELEKSVRQKGMGKGKVALSARIPTNVRSTTLQSYRQPTTHMYPHNTYLYLSE